MRRILIAGWVAILGLALTSGGEAPAQNANSAHVEQLIVPKLLNHDELMGLTVANRAAYLLQVHVTLVQLEAIQKKFLITKKNSASRALVHDMIAQFSWIESIYSETVPQVAQPCVHWTSGCTGG